MNSPQELDAQKLDAQKLDVSVILPVYNEVGHIQQEVDRITKSLDASPYSYELIVIDDASKDGTSEALMKMRNRNIRLIRFATNRGSGTARREGTIAARGRAVVWTDADMTYPNDKIPELVADLDGYDQVVGARRTEEGTHKLLRVPAKWFLRKLASYLTKTKIPDLNSGFRAFRREIGLQFVYMLPTGFSCVTTITMAFMANGYSVRYVPINYAKRAGKSKFHWRRDTAKYLTQIVRMVLSYNPLRVFMPLGLTLLGVGVVKLGYDWITRDLHLATNTLLILFAALLTISIGLLADLIVTMTKPRNLVSAAAMSTVDLSEMTDGQQLSRTN